MGAMRFPPHHYLLHGVLSELKVEFSKSLGARSLIVTNVERYRWLLLPIRTNEKAATCSSTTSGSRVNTNYHHHQRQLHHRPKHLIVNINIIFVKQYKNQHQRQNRVWVWINYFLFQGITLPPLWALDQMQRLMKNLYWRWNQSSDGSLFKQQCDCPLGVFLLYNFLECSTECYYCPLGVLPLQYNRFSGIAGQFHRRFEEPFWYLQ